MSLFITKSESKVVVQALGAVDAEISYTFPAKTRAFSIQNRNGNSFKFAWDTGGIAAGNYFTWPASTIMSEDHIYFASGKTIYFMATNANDTLEIEYWK